VPEAMRIAPTAEPPSTGHDTGAARECSGGNESFLVACAQRLRDTAICQSGGT
jgi:hypothetical protein